MTTLLRRNLTCFYCGGRSPCPTLEKLHHFKCPKCEAVNYLDENGEITDPPALETPTSPHQYAHLVPRATSPELGAQDGELFCQNCQKNQFLLTQALAEYLPPQNDPKYAEYEAASEQYRRSLEDRYPQVCINCAPRVQNRLRAAGYAAKTDHLRRMMEKTRHGPVYPAGSSWGWRNLIVFLGGGTYLWSILLGLLWHIFGALMRQEDGTSAVGVLGFRVCLEQAAKEHSVEPKCFVFVIPMAQYALVLGVLSFWWNYKLQDKVRGSGGRMVGLWSYLRLQILVLAVRAASLWYLQNVLPIKNALEIFRAAHSFMIVFILLVDTPSPLLIGKLH
ncbi:hypothetical protein K432DRAFT_350468 [Lepidopterella palustris CBS 459.81]|uniref:Ima1 N-terminal domain-containing protein n=1 Tax=Lepidopterella palustris CBS 459.81 TaxID=1314670 RepID=A0A8E2EDI6_9PEZI|nr:hypothetical protein K432DRAFT_350468 [Lepidopterella palustris CBS 459.81]